MGELRAWVGAEGAVISLPETCRETARGTLQDRMRAIDHFEKTGEASEPMRKYLADLARQKTIGIYEQLQAMEAELPPPK